MDQTDPRNNVDYASSALFRFDPDQGLCNLAGPVTMKRRIAAFTAHMEEEMPVQAADIMTRKVVTVQPDLHVIDIARTLTGNGISAVPVCEADGTVVGIVSESDIMHPFSAEKMRKRARWLDLLAEGTELAPEFINYVRTERRTARDLMTHPVVSATEETTLPKLAELMTQHNVKRLPVLRAGKLVGIVSRSDVVRALANSSIEAASAT